METKELIVFEEIIAPVIPLIEKEADKLGDDAKKYKLSFLPFTLNLLFGIISGIKSIIPFDNKYTKFPCCKSIRTGECLQLYVFRSLCPL